MFYASIFAWHYLHILYCKAMFMKIHKRILVVCLFFFAFYSSIALSAPAPAKKAPAPVPVKKAVPAPAPKSAGITASEMKEIPPTQLADEPSAAGEEAEGEEVVKKDEDPVDIEIAFMKGLIRMRMPDYAQKALDKLILKSPETKPRASSIKIDILAGVGKYDEAEAMIAAMPQDTLETWFMKLSLAEHYYQAGKMIEAKAGYEAFFKKYEKGPPAGMEKFYMEQAYKYAQMLIFKNDEEAAVDAFRCVLNGKPPRDIEFKIRIDLAELCVKLAEKTADPKKREVFFQKTREACEPVLWKDNGGPLFGKALMILAHMEMIKGDKKAAKKLISTNLPMLRELEKVLKENKISLDFSPMAECRYLLATIAEEEGREFLKQGKTKECAESWTVALNHFVNVLAQYQTSQWAVPAGEGQDRVAELMRSKLNLDVKLPSFDRSKIMGAVLKEAQAKFEQNLFQEASRKYLIYVNNVPEQDASVAALGELARCYIEMGDTNYFDAVTGYLAQRFCQNPHLEDNAGTAFLRAAATAEALNNKELCQKVYDYYIKYFPRHKRMASVLYKFGDDKAKEKDYDRAIGYFQLISTNYIKSPVYFAALSKMAYCYSMMNDFSNAVQVLNNTIAALPPGTEEIETRYRLGDTYRRMDKIVPAINEFAGIITSITGTNKAAYAKTTEDVTRIKGLMESVYFWKAYCYAMLNKGYAPDKIKVFQQKAIDDFTKFVADYPKSPLSPTALSRYGSLLYAVGRSDDANKAFSRLVTEYPDAPESKDVVFVQGMSLIEMKKMDKAIEVFGRMLENEKAFSAPQYLRVGRIMFEAKEYPTAIKFYERAKKLAVKDKTVNRVVWEPAVFGIGEAYFTQGNSAEAVKAIGELFARYKNTSLFLEASFVLSKAYADLGAKENDKVKKEGLYIKANAAIAKGMTVINPTNTFARFKANLQIADVQTLQGNKGGATASYFRMLGSGNWNDVNLRPYMEEALIKGLPLLGEREDMVEEVVNIGTKYLEACPRGQYIREARKMRDAAKLKMALSGKKMDAESDAAPAAAPPTAGTSGDTTNVATSTTVSPVPPPAATGTAAAAAPAPASPATVPVVSGAVAAAPGTKAVVPVQPAAKPAGQLTAPPKGN